MTAESLQPVIDSNMCIACGACAVADSSVKLEVRPRKQMIEPSSAGGERAASVCPAVAVDFEGLQKHIFGEDAPIAAHGVVDSVFLGQSTDTDRNYGASSGGVLKELLIDFLNDPEIDGVIALSHVDGLDFEPTLVTDPAQVDSLPGSIYHNLSQQRALEILRDNDGRFVLVAIPCQLEGVWNYVTKVDPRLEKRIAATVGLLCGWQYTYHALRAICEYKGIPYDDIRDVAYRGGGPVGKLRFRTSDGEHTVGRRLDYSYQVAFDRSFNTPRCHVCINHHNMLADVVVGDAWLPSTVMTKTGVSLLVSRRPEMTARLQRLSDQGTIRLADGSLDDITDSQGRRVLFGDFAYAYADYRRDIGEHTPDMVGPNRAEAQLRPRSEAARFHRELNRKLALQRRRKYRTLWWRKGTIEGRRYAARYVNWALKMAGLKSSSKKSARVTPVDLSDFR